ncbi:MAG TPA: Wzz/FepE/Etk N-terminal domain-containing protein [Flavipsychrobacter sp.]|nr:Wzz/FepE/Etk N-terminal domain-containing protein [Flavipsychrobacter sp.]
MSTPSFDLVDIVHTIRNRRKFVLIITLLAAIAGILFHSVRKKRYQAKTEFLIMDPLYTDRNNIFRNTEMRFIDYFAGEDDIDRVIAIAESDTVIDKIIRVKGLAVAYNVDTTKPGGFDKLRTIFTKLYDIKRTEYKDAVLTYIDEDPTRAAQVANESVHIIEDAYKSYYIDVKANMYQALHEKLLETDTAIGKLTDSLSALRDRYHIYDIISPARQNVIVGTIKESGVAGFGKAIEEIQNIESIKDQLVIDRAKYVSLLNEYTTGIKMNQMALTHVITKATTPDHPKGPGLILTTIICALLGFFFSVCIVLLLTYYNLIISVKR